MAELKIKADSGGGTVSLKGPATTTSNAAVQLTLPVDDGTANQYLKTDGSGALSWATVASPVTALNNATANELVTVGSTTTELDAEANLTFDGNNLTLGDGNLIVASGHGIDFSATGDGSGTDTSELLDDYEEGEWTPVMNTGAGAVSNYATERTGRYTRVGNLCHVSFSVKGASNSGLNSGSGDLWISGLPYNMYAHPHASLPGFVYLEPDTDSNYTVYWMTCEYYTDKMYIYGKANSGGQTNMGGNLSAASMVIGRTTFLLA